MKYLSLFTGIGAPEKALKNLGIDFELVGFSEIDKYAAKAYCAIHDVDESMNLGDITKIDETALPKDIDLITYGFPCQDISVAGKSKGLFNEDGTQTRSGLFFDALRIIEATQPRIAIAENVKNLTGKKFKEQFELILNCLESAGYNNYWQVLNAKDYGIPQNRERVFIVSIRKDIDDGSFEFPEPFPLELRLKDMLEEQVDEKFYLNYEQTSRITRSSFNQEKARIQDVDGVASTLLSRDYKDPKCVPGEGIQQVAQLYPNSGNPQAGRVYDAGGISPAMDTCQVGNRMPKIAIREATKKCYVEAEEGDFVNIGMPNSQTRRGRVGRGIANTLTTMQEGAVVDAVKEIVGVMRNCDVEVTVHDNGDIRPYRLDKKKSGISELQINKDTNVSHTITTAHMPKIYGNSTGFRIRKLTPKECWRLMGFDDIDHDKAAAVCSNSQLYKQAGNSIVVDVLENLFRGLPL